ncbi:MAG: cell division protein FtsH [Rhodospirillales bacterium CG15_BIG_FIL_POST_REV_8_21_14_020_66_15]|nr:MAG: cell division protein FtsH [Rhodospirillales bacterium CG15_BIG_FIL_POST_REV_8_21_14_020_66_15]
MEKKHQINVLYIVFTVLAVLMLQNFLLSRSQVSVIPYSSFERELQQGNVSEVVVSENLIRGTFRNPVDGKSMFRTRRIEPEMADRLAKFDVRVLGETEDTWLTRLFSWIFPLLFFLVVWMFVIRKFAERQGLGEGYMSLGKSNAKIYVESDIKVTFKDVAGVDEAKTELIEIVDFLKDPARYGRLGGRIPKGVLLVGPPGTGKTLLARAVAGEAGVAFLSISGSEFVEMFVGLGAARVRDLFKQAREKVPCIIFIDELDALGRARGVGPLSGGHDEKEQTLNQLLAELDGFDPSDGLVLLAATNRPEILDPALLRAGRFDRQVLVDRPDKTGRVAILAIHLKKAKLASDVDADQIAALTPGFTGADLANLVNEATLLATRRNADAVAMEDFNQAVERIIAGLEKKNRLLNAFERRTIAFHEMGHAIVALCLPGSDKVHKVSIIPRGIGALGYTIQRPTEDRYLMSRKELENKMAVLMGGRAAESIVFKSFSTGAADDLARATEIARSMVTQYGMVESLGQVAYDKQPHSFLGQQQEMTWLERRYSEETAREIDCAVRALVQGAFDKAVGILTRNRATLETTATRLLETETLDEGDLAGLTTGLVRAEAAE